MMKGGHPWIRRLLLALAALVLALAAVEGGLRLAYMDLPSQAALSGTRYKIQRVSSSQFAVTSRHAAPLCGSVTYVEHNGPFRHRRLGPASSRTVRLWVVGDSVTAGMGVRPGEAYGTRLAEALSRRLGAQVALTTIASPGGTTAPPCSLTASLASLRKKSTM